MLWANGEELTKYGGGGGGGGVGGAGGAGGEGGGEGRKGGVLMIYEVNWNIHIFIALLKLDGLLLLQQDDACLVYQ